MIESTDMDGMLMTDYRSPCGVLRVGSASGGLCFCDWENRRNWPVILRRVCSRLGFPETGISGVAESAMRELDEYFAGSRREFDVPLRTVGTSFQEQVWSEIRRIPYGATVTYGELARRLGCPRSVRAVANAVGANAISIFIPCHRVVGIGDNLTGYAGGIEAKRYLLDLERRMTGQ